MRVLVADPDPVSRFLLRRGVGNAGHECVAVEDGLSAWETYQRARPDTVIAAVAMAQIDGVELCKRIRRGPAPDAYLILLVDEGDDDLISRSARAGADACIDRPIVRHLLQVQLDGARKATERRRADAEATG